MRTPRESLILLATIVVCGLFIGAAYKRGIERGMATAIEYGPFSFQMPLACAITDTVYKFNLGYACAAPVYRKLVEVQMAGDESENVIPRLSDGAIINESIRAASSLGPLTPGTFDTGELMTPYYNDLGMVDFIKIGFRLYGPRIESLYNLFFTLLAASTIAFILAFPGNLLAGLAIIAVAFGFFAELFSNMFTPLMPTVYSMRYPSTLAIIPTLHLTLLTVWRQRLTPTAFLLGLLQAALLVFAMRIRFSAIWGVVLIFSAVVIQAAWSLYRAVRTRDIWQVAAIDGVRALFRWPAVIVFILLLSNAIHLRSVIHPVYESDDALPMHLTWAPWFINYAAFDPDAMALSGLTGAAAYGDDIAWQAARLYAERVHLIKDPATLNLTMTKFGTRIAFHDVLMRRVFLDYIARHPLRALKVYLFVKVPIVPIRYWRDKAAAFQTWLTVSGFALAAIFAACLVLLPWSLSQGASMLAVMAGAVIASGLPHVAGAPNLVYFGDMFIIWPAAFYVGTPLALLLLIRRNRPSWLKWGAVVTS